MQEASLLDNEIGPKMVCAGSNNGINRFLGNREKLLLFGLDGISNQILSI